MTEKVNDDLVNKIMNELDETNIQCDPVFDAPEKEITTVVEANDAPPMPKKKKKKKKPVILVESSDDEEEQEVLPKIKIEPESESEIKKISSFEDKFYNVISILKKTLIITFVFFAFLKLKPALTNLISNKFPSINLVNLDNDDLNTTGILIFSLTFAIGLFLVQFFRKDK